MLTVERAKEIVADLLTKLTRPVSPLFFPPSASAIRWCDGKEGIEIGPAAHNPFDFEPPSRKVIVGDEDDFRFFAEHQIQICGAAAIPDIIGEADELPIASGSLDYVLTSHVFEHLCNPMKALAEWHRVLRPGGIIYTIVPLRNAHPPDASRPISRLDEIVEAADGGWSTADCPPQEEHGGPRGHRFVYTVDLFFQIVSFLGFDNFAVEEVLDRDDKVGNGFAVVLSTKDCESVRSKTKLFWALGKK